MNDSDRIDEILATHRSETWATGWNNDATERAKAAIEALVREERKDELTSLLGSVESVQGFNAVAEDVIESRIDALELTEEK